METAPTIPPELSKPLIPATRGKYLRELLDAAGAWLGEVRPPDQFEVWVGDVMMNRAAIRDALLAEDIYIGEHGWTAPDNSDPAAHSLDGDFIIRLGSVLSDETAMPARRVKRAQALLADELAARAAGARPGPYVPQDPDYHAAAERSAPMKAEYEAGFESVAPNPARDQALLWAALEEQKFLRETVSALAKALIVKTGGTV